MVDFFFLIDKVVILVHGNHNLKCFIISIKEERLLSDLTNQKLICGMEIAFTSIDDNDDEFPPYLIKYLVDSIVKKENRA
nr:hypothetical protein [uncultured Bacteroides sp.]